MQVIPPLKTLERIYACRSCGAFLFTGGHVIKVRRLAPWSVRAPARAAFIFRGQTVIFFCQSNASYHIVGVLYCSAFWLTDGTPQALQPKYSTTNTVLFSIVMYPVPGTYDIPFCVAQYYGIFRCASSNMPTFVIFPVCRKSNMGEVRRS